jgi:hypothetical protein
MSAAAVLAALDAALELADGRAGDCALARCARGASGLSHQSATAATEPTEVLNFRVGGKVGIVLIYHNTPGNKTYPTYYQQDSE